MVWVEYFSPFECSTLQCSLRAITLSSWAFLFCFVETKCFSGKISELRLNFSGVTLGLAREGQNVVNSCAVATPMGARGNWKTSPEKKNRLSSFVAAFLSVFAWNVFVFLCLVFAFTLTLLVNNRKIMFFYEFSMRLVLLMQCKFLSPNFLMTASLKKEEKNVGKKWRR